MKHVFYIQNHITKICMDSVVDHLKIDWKDVIIITFEKYKKSFAPFEKDYSEAAIYDYKMEEGLTEGGKIIGAKNEWKRHHRTKAIVGSNPFTLYSPVDSRNLLRHLIFLKNCSAYYLIEEGLSTYFDFSAWQFEKKPFKWTWLLQPKATQYITQHPINKYEKLKGAYGFSETSYPYLDERSVIPMKMVSEQKGTLDSDFSSEVIVFDGMVDNGQCSISHLVEFLSEALDSIEAKTFYYKFHVRQSAEEREAIQDLFKTKGVEGRQLGDAVIVEELSYNNEFRLYGFYSSLLYYHTKLSNGSAMSFGKWFLSSLPAEKAKAREKSIFGKVALDLFENNGIKQILPR